jgi:hypothetical protein
MQTGKNEREEKIKTTQERNKKGEEKKFPFLEQHSSSRGPLRSQSFVH